MSAPAAVTKYDFMFFANSIVCAALALHAHSRLRNLRITQYTTGYRLVTVQTSIHTFIVIATV